MVPQSKKHLVMWTVSLIGIMLLVRILYATVVPQVFYNSDSDGYLGLGRGMYTNPSLPTIINPYRTPLYPLFFQGILIASGRGVSDSNSPAFFQGASVVAGVQSLLAISAFVLIFFALLSLPLPIWLCFCLTLIVSCDELLFAWERTMLTEGLAVPWMVTLTAATLFAMRTRKLRWYGVLLGLFIVGFLLRPALLFIPLIVVGVLVVHERSVRMGVIAVVMLAIYLSVPLGYAKVNEYYHQYYGIQHVGDIDLLGKILEFRLPVDTASSYSFYHDAVIDSWKKGMMFPNPFRFIEYYDPGIYEETNGVARRLNELPGFNKTVILHTIPTYVYKTMLSVPAVLMEVCDFITIPVQKASPVVSLFRVLEKIAIVLQYAFFAVPILWVVSIYQYIKRPTHIRAVLIVFGAIALAQLLFTASVVYTDVDRQFGRLMAVVRPEMILFLMIWLYEGVKRKKTT